MHVPIHMMIQDIKQKKILTSDVALLPKGETEILAASVPPIQSYLRFSKR
jgi:hypothetical protein